MFGKKFYEEVKQDVVKKVVDYLIDNVLKKLVIKVRNHNGRIILTEVKAGEMIDIDLVDHSQENNLTEKTEE